MQRWQAAAPAPARGVLQARLDRMQDALAEAVLAVQDQLALLDRAEGNAERHLTGCQLALQAACSAMATVRHAL